MNKEGKPVNKELEKLNAIAREVMGNTNDPSIDFADTQKAFQHKSDEDLKHTAWLFGLMNRHWLVGIGSTVGLAAIRMHLPFVETAVKNTIFRQFCGGTTLLEAETAIEDIYRYGVQSILDYGAEGKNEEEELNATMNENIRAAEFASQHDSIPMLVIKISGLASNALLESLGAGEPLTPNTRKAYKNVLKRLDAICHKAEELGVTVLIDAEESWIQNAIDHLATLMMERYNKESAIVYNTFQLYRTDRLKFLMNSHDEAQKKGYKLGAKLVRGAYMEKERERAQEKGYTSPIHSNKQATDDAFDTALRFCIDNLNDIAFINATHNAKSTLLMTKLIEERKIPKDHPHLMFAQLYGMSDNLSFVLADQGYRSAKYMVYGSVREVLPYLIRRAQENSSITGDMTREHQLVVAEMKRRALS